MREEVFFFDAERSKFWRAFFLYRRKLVSRVINSPQDETILHGSCS